ncbi:MAG: GAF domain-containing protein [Deltaproteobacteria bacterium]|nr:GAF domain-containing protein [Deltaproteobacteria bacterium]
MNAKNENSPWPTLRVTGSDGRIHNHPLLKQETSIGRGKDNDLVLSDHTVSRYHAKILKTMEGVLLTDLGSFNGTKVNERSIQSALLQHRDVVSIGLVRMIFLTRAESTPSLSDSLVISTETDFDKGRQHIVESSSVEADPAGSQSLLISLEAQRAPLPRGPSPAAGREGPDARVQAEISSLERSNKVLFVLYEISRQLNSIHDFHELLNKIMDLIFMVIDADHGYLILTDGEKEDELNPVVVKSRQDAGKQPGELRASRTIIRKVIRDKVALLTSNAMADTRLEHGKSLFIQQIRSAICVPLWQKNRIIGVIQLESVRLENQFDQDDLELLKAIGSQMAMVIEQSSLNQQIREEERMRNRLERFHSPQIIEMILRSGQETKDNIMEPKDLTATILFTDINGFTRLSEHMPPREINMLLNRYFSRMTDIIFTHDGTLDKYIGDGLMAVFGAPMEKKDDPERAILAALEMRSDLAAMMEGVEPPKRFSIRIGINTGRVVGGNIGSPRRMDYTVIGDPVNVASRLESIAQPNQILIGEETCRLVKDRFKVREVGLRKVKGRSSQIMVYEVL